LCPEGALVFQYSLNIEEQSREGDFILDEKGVRMFVDMFSAQYLNGVEIDYVSRRHGLRLHVQESERHRQLRVRYFVHRLTCSE
jgi:Fe-S cluster assembly iron-binding protein IscA